MKAIKTITLFMLLAASALCQNITGTLGSNGSFVIKDGVNNYLTLSQSTGQLTLLRGLRLELTGNNSNSGVIFKGADRFIHDFNPSGTTGNNTFIGINAGNFSMLGSGSQSSFNIGVGNYSLSSITTGSYNTALGYRSLYSNRSGYNNTALGFEALFYNTMGNYNTAQGYQSMYKNVSGSYNTALGFESIFSNISGNYNTAQGLQSLYYNTTGSYNTAQGFESIFSNTTGNDNTAVGFYSLYSNTIGNDNTAVGYQSLLNNTTGSTNTALGYLAGSTITTGSNVICIGYNVQPSSSNVSDQITIGDGNITSLRCNVTTITSLSDARDKKNIRDLSLGLDFILKLKPRVFNWDKREWYENHVSDGSKMKSTPTAGFIAQELDSAQIKESAEWLNLVLKDNPDRIEATTGNLLPIIVKAIQDLKAENDALKENNSALSKAIDKLNDENSDLTQRVLKIEELQNMLAIELVKLRNAEFKTVENSNISK